MKTRLRQGYGAAWRGMKVRVKRDSATEARRGKKRERDNFFGHKKSRRVTKKEEADYGDTGGFIRGGGLLLGLGWRL